MHVSDVRDCYNAALARDPGQAGRVEVEFMIGTTGVVERATALSSTLTDEKVASCITRAMRDWRFPAPTSGGPVGVRYPFVLEPG